VQLPHPEFRIWTLWQPSKDQPVVLPSNTCCVRSGSPFAAPRQGGGGASRRARQAADQGTARARLRKRSGASSIGSCPRLDHGQPSARQFSARAPCRCEEVRARVLRTQTTRVAAVFLQARVQIFAHHGETGDLPGRREQPLAQLRAREDDVAGRSAAAAAAQGALAGEVHKPSAGSARVHEFQAEVS